MLRELFSFCINGMRECLNLARTFILDEPLGITFFHFLIFIPFITIVLKLIGFIKQIQEVESEKEANFNKQQKLAYNDWLSNHPSTPRRYR